MSVALDTLPDMRTFSHGSTLTDGGLALDLAPALTPAGLVNQPGFFHGFATHPVVVTRSLLVLADIAATRYFRPTPAGMRDHSSSSVVPEVRRPSGLAATKARWSARSSRYRWVAR